MHSFIFSEDAKQQVVFWKHKTLVPEANFFENFLPKKNSCCKCIQDVFAAYFFSCVSAQVNFMIITVGKRIFTAVAIIFIWGPRLKTTIKDRKSTRLIH